MSTITPLPKPEPVISESAKEALNDIQEIANDEGLSFVCIVAVTGKGDTIRRFSGYPSYTVIGGLHLCLQEASEHVMDDGG